MQQVLFIVLGVAVFGAGLWWLWGGRWRWLPAARFQLQATLPTRMVVAIVHLVLGYHLVVWFIPGERRPLQLPRNQWPWLVLGAAGAVGALKLLDRADGSRDDGGADRTRP